MKKSKSFVLDSNRAGEASGEPGAAMANGVDGGESSSGCSKDPPPKLPKGRRLLDATVGTDVDSLYKSVFGNDSFFEIVCSKCYEELKSFEVTPWSSPGGGPGGVQERLMRYEISKYIAFSRQVVQVQQTQVRAAYCRRGAVYGVDTVTRNSGVVYSDYFVIHIHYRMTADPARQGDRSRMEVVADIEFVKPCLFKARIESESWSGMKKYYEVMDKEILTERDMKGSAGGGENGGVAALEDSGLAAATAGPADPRSGPKYLKESYNRQRLMRDGGEGPARGGAGWTAAHPAGGEHEAAPAASASAAGMSQEALSCALLLIIATLLLLTVAMFKMNSALTRLDERMDRLDQILRDRGALFVGGLPGAAARGGDQQEYNSEL